jgi:hypothetical protein
MLILAPMMSSVGPKLRYLIPNPTWKVTVKFATYIATAPKYVRLARQIFWYAQQEQVFSNNSFQNKVFKLIKWKTKYTTLSEQNPIIFF